MSDFVGAALNTADLVTKVTGIAVDFMTSIGCEGFCELFDFGKSILFEAIKSGRLDYQTRKALDDLDPRIVDDLKCFVGQQLKKYSKKGKLPKKLKGKDLVDVFMNRLDTVSKLVDDYAVQNNVSEEQRIALKYILNEIRQCTAQASLLMLNAEDKRFALVISQIVRNTFEDYREDFAQGLSKTLFIRPTRCRYCASPNLIIDDEKGIARCKNCGTVIQYEQNGQSALLCEAKSAFSDEFRQINKRFEDLYGISVQILNTVQKIERDIDIKSRLNIAQDHILNYDFDKAKTTCESIIKDYPDSVEAMWCYLQALFGIVYLKGYNETKAKPTFCHPINPLSTLRFCDHEYYQKILVLLQDDPENRSVYEARQREIDKAIATVQNDLTKKQEYDVFICVKIGLATDNDQIVDPNRKTEDFELYAKRIYKELTEKKHLRVFCSQITCQQGIAYDEQIWSAMLRSKTILVIGTRKDYLESVWVQCEWRRWLYLYKSLGIRDASSFVALIPSERWVDIKPSVWDDAKISVWQDVDSAISAIVNKLKVPITSAKRALEEEIADIRALLDRGQIAEAKKRLSPLLHDHPSSGELQLLDLRIKSNNFKNLKKIMPHDIEVACRYLKSASNENPEYRMYINQKRLDVPPVKRVKKTKKPRVPKKKINLPWKKIGLTVAVTLAIMLLIALGCWGLHSYGLNSSGLSYTMDEQLGGYVVSEGLVGITRMQEDIVIPDQYNGLPVVAIASNTFSDNMRLRTVFIPDTVKTVGSSAFKNCKNLSEVHIGSGVVWIESSVFSGCDALADIVIPDSVEYIGQAAFWGCKSLSSINIPEGVTDIEPYVFSGCSNLVSVTFPSTLKRIDENAFNENNKVTELNYNGFKENWAEIDKGQWWNQYLLTNTINCLDGAAVVYSIQWNLNGGESDYEYPTEYIYGKGIPATQFPTPTYEGMLFCGWQMNGKYVTSIDSSVNGNVTLDAVWVKSSYSISGASRSERSTSKEFSYHYELVGHIRIPDELRDMIARGKVKLIIRGEISVSVQSQGDATATASTWLVITPNAALGDRNIDTEKCSQSAKGGGYTSGFLGLGKEPKDGNKLSNTIEFSTTVPIIGYASEIPVYSYMEYNSNKENDEVNISIWSSLNELTYEFVVK